MLIWGRKFLFSANDIRMVLLVVGKPDEHLLYDNAVSNLDVVSARNVHLN